jgi:hypothetical protein
MSPGTVAKTGFSFAITNTMKKKKPACFDDEIWKQRV